MKIVRDRDGEVEIADLGMKGGGVSRWEWLGSRGRIIAHNTSSDVSDCRSFALWKGIQRSAEHSHRRRHREKISHFCK
jgi:hypothetical protein